MTSWYKKPVTPYLFFYALVVFSLLSLLKVEFGGNIPTSVKGFSVITQHYGINSEEIERTITIPIEESISVISGIEQLRSTSEYAKSRVEVRLREDTDSTEFYLNLRDRIERVYSTMPKSVQKPQIVTSSTNQKQSFIISFSSSISDPVRLRPFIENEVKPSFEKIQGIGEIEVGGGALKEIHVELNEEKLTFSGQSPSNIASIIQSQNLFSPLGKIVLPQQNIPVSMDGRFKSIDELKNIKIPTQTNTDIYLNELATVKYGHRKPETISRVNGQEKVVLYIKTGGDANIVSLSRKISKVTQRWEDKGLNVETIYNQGDTMIKSIKQVLTAMLIGMVIVALFMIITVRDLKQSLILSLSLPITGIACIAVLTLLKIPLDNFILSGIAIAIGIIIDTGIILTEYSKNRENIISKIIPPLISSTLTSVIVLFPLLYMRKTISGIGPISIALLIMLLTSLILNILFIPVFFKGKIKSVHTPVILTRLKFSILRVCRFSYNRAGSILIFSTVLTVVAFITLFIKGSGFSSILEEPVIFAHVEMESGASVKSVDNRLKKFIPIIEKHPGVVQVESIAKRGNGQLTIRYNDKVIDNSDLISWLKEKSAVMPRSSLYIPEETQSESIKVEIAITGDENKELRKLAKETLNKLINNKWVVEGVLHFKDPPPAYVLDIDNSQYPITGLDSKTIVDRFRWDLQGPVADKWIENGDEIDLRVMGEGNRGKSYKDLKKLPFTNTKSSDSTFVRADQVGNFIESTEPSRIYRNNKQRCIYLSVKVVKSDLDSIEKNIWGVLDNIQLPKGYAFELDRRLQKQKKELNSLWLLFILAIFLIYTVLSCQSESFKAPVIILAFIPLSLSFPITALNIIGKSISTSTLIGFIVLTGMVVNNAILIIDYCQNIKNKSIQETLFTAISSRLKPLLLTSGTTIFGTLPLLLSSQGSFNLLNTLSYIMLFGILGSIYTSLVFLPALARKWPKGFKLNN